MSLNQPVHRIAIVGTGVIGTSWAAYYLSRGFDVVATDPGPQAEATSEPCWSRAARASLSGSPEVG
jgi:glycine/D-amino acid oxidase-like deaminating enzyme